MWLHHRYGGEKLMWLHKPCPLSDPHNGQKSVRLHNPYVPGTLHWGEIKMASQPLPSRNPQSGEKSMWLHYHCLLGIPVVGISQCGYMTPAFS